MFLYRSSFLFWLSLSLFLSLTILLYFPILSSLSLIGNTLSHFFGFDSIFCDNSPIFQIIYLSLPHSFYLFLYLSLSLFFPFLSLIVFILSTLSWFCVSFHLYLFHFSISLSHTHSNSLPFLPYPSLFSLLSFFLSTSSWKLFLLCYAFFIPLLTHPFFTLSCMSLANFLRMNASAWMSTTANTYLGITVYQNNSTQKQKRKIFIPHSDLSCGP